MRNPSSKLVIVTGFSLILVLIGFISLLAMYSVASNSRSLDEIVEKQDKMADIFAMRDIAHQRVLLLYTMLSIEDVFELDELHVKYLEQADDFMQARDRFRLHSEEEFVRTAYTNAWEPVSPLVSRSADLQKNVLDLILNEQLDEAYLLLETEVLSSQNLVIAALTQLLDTHYVVINKQLKAAQNANQNYLYFIIIIGTIILLTGILITYHVTSYNTGIQNELIKQHHAAQEASIAKSDFLANMSHEIRTPLASIIGFSEALIENEYNEKQYKKVTSTIIRNGKHLQQIINDILDISKIEAGQLVIEHIASSPFRILDEIDSFMGQKAKEKHLEFVTNYHFPLPDKILTDPTRLKQILINLCGNAIKFTEHGQIAIDISYDADYRQMKFVVMDTGIGMTHEETTRIFNPFTQADSTTTRKYGGTGLGLSISSKLARELNGQLMCNSYKGRGTFFTLTLPVNTDNMSEFINRLEDVSKVRDEHSQPVDIKQLHGSILLVEDTPDNQQLIAMHINRTGAELSIVENGQQALDACKSETYDVILMDMQMPVMDGEKATRRLRASGYSNPIVALTANATTDSKKKCIAAGADAYLVKPIDTQLFYDMLNIYLPVSVSTNSQHTPDSEPVLKLDAALKNTAQYKAVVAHFLDKLPDMVKKISRAAHEKDWHTAQSESHDLKGMGGAMGYPKITEISGQLNTHIKLKNYDDAITSCEKLEIICKDALLQNKAV